MGHKSLDDMKKDDSVQELSELKKDLIKLMSAELHSKGVNDLDAEDCGKVTDMIKDLAEAKKYCMEACYYESIVHAMEMSEKDEADEDDRMGYNNRRYASGRYAPKGRGRMMGYIPPMNRDAEYIDGYLHDPNFRGDMSYGYSANGNTSMLQNQNGDNNRMGYVDPDMADDTNTMSYKEYKRAKRQYHESQSTMDKKSMDEKGMHAFNRSIDAMREIWKETDPALRQNMKAALTAFVGEMK